jgi:electron transport complex protein RnfE
VDEHSQTGVTQDNKAQGRTTPSSATQDCVKSLRKSPLDVVLEAVLYGNPIVVQAVGIAPVIAICTTLKNGLGLSLAFAFVLFPLQILANLFGKYISAFVRPVVYALAASVLLAPATFIVKLIFPEVPETLGIFLPLIAVNALLLDRAERAATRHTLSQTVVDALSLVVSLSVLVCVLSAVREVFGQCAIFGVPLPYNKRIGALDFPFAGFILLGFLSAAVGSLVRALRKRRMGRDDREVA